MGITKWREYWVQMARSWAASKWPSLSTQTNPRSSTIHIHVFGQPPWISIFHESRYVPVDRTVIITWAYSEIIPIP
uniref:Uncharacterized protein n=1 Tax=Anguilla anguilla TaxID=7936 RepID=A0A0E9U7X5_ANGAN